MNLSDDCIVSAAVYSQDHKQLFVIADNGAMKRIRISDIDIMGRPTRGNMICKKVKSRPYQLRDIRILDLNDTIVFIDKEPMVLMMKDVSLMSRDATFSTPLSLSSDFYMMKELTFVRLAEAPKEEETIEEHDHQLNFDL